MKTNCSRDSLHRIQFTGFSPPKQLHEDFADLRQQKSPANPNSSGLSSKSCRFNAPLNPESVGFRMYRGLPLRRPNSDRAAASLHGSLKARAVWCKPPAPSCLVNAGHMLVRSQSSQWLLRLSRCTKPLLVDNYKGWCYSIITCVFLRKMDYNSGL